MAATDHMNDRQFGKHEAKVTKPGRTTSGETVEVAASRTTPVDTGYSPRHAAGKFRK